MGNPIVATSFATFTPSATSAAPDHPVTNVLRYGRPYIGWAANVSGESIVTADCGSAISMVGSYVRNTNADSVIVETSPNNSTWTPVLTTAINRNPRIGRRQGYQAFTDTKRYVRWRFTNSGGLTGDIPWGGDQPWMDQWPGSFGSGASGGPIQVGEIILLTAQTSLTEGLWTPFEWEPVEPFDETPLLGGRVEINEGYYRALEMWLSLKGDRDNAAALTEAAAVSAITTAKLFLIYLNRGDTSEAFLCQRAEDDDPLTEGIPLIERPFHVREAM